MLDVLCFVTKLRKAEESYMATYFMYLILYVSDLRQNTKRQKKRVLSGLSFLFKLKLKPLTQPLSEFRPQKIFNSHVSFCNPTRVYLNLIGILRMKIKCVWSRNQTILIKRHHHHFHCRQQCTLESTLITTSGFQQQ